MSARTRVQTPAPNLRRSLRRSRPRGHPEVRTALVKASPAVPSEKQSVPGPAVQGVGAATVLVLVGRGTKVICPRSPS